jgi:hypothetical protein
MPQFDVSKLSEDELRRVQNDVLRTLIDRVSDDGGPTPIGPHDSHASVHSKNSITYVTFAEDAED